MNRLRFFPYEHVLVLGLAKSGTAAATLLLHNGKKVRINDGNPLMDVRDEERFLHMGAEIVLGSHPLSVLDGIDLIVKNPGIRYDHLLIVEATKRKIPVITEVELAANIAQDQMIGITGSNGKTTTTTLITRMFEEARKPVQVAGNIGVVASEVAETLRDNETMVVELSSFQLQGTHAFKPRTAVLLNLFQAHLDYHGTMEEYVTAKQNMFVRQTEDDVLIYNADQPLVVETIHHAQSKKVPFSTTDYCEHGAWLDKDFIYYGSEKVAQIKDVALVGNHNLENILAAICVAKEYNIPNEAIQHVLKTFTGVEHRLQYITNIAGRKFYNDSKATNLLATEKALASFSEPTILLAGGLDRGDDYDQLLPFLKNVRTLISFGETAEKLQDAGRKANIHQLASVETMDEAVQKAYAYSEEGDIILLSPACASWDQYATFEERGSMFTNAVHRLV